MLSDFRSPGLGEDTLGWKDPSYYTTIQTANVDGTPGVEMTRALLERHASLRVQAAAGRQRHRRRDVVLLASGGPFTDAGNWRDPQYYSTVRAVGAQGRSYAISHDGTGLISASWPGAGWTYESHTSELAGCSQPNCYHSLRVLPGEGRFSAAEPGSSFGQSVKSFQGPGRGWTRVPVDGGSFPSGPLSNAPGPDCPLDVTGDCFPKFVWLWETTRWANLAPQGAGLPQLVALAPQGLLAYNPVPGRSSASIAWQPLHNLDALTYPVLEWIEDPGKAASLTVADIDGQGGDEVLALQDGQLKAWSYNAAADAWTQLQPTTPLALSDTAVWNQDGPTTEHSAPATWTATVARRSSPAVPSESAPGSTTAAERAAGSATCPRATRTSRAARGWPERSLLDAEPAREAVPLHHQEPELGARRVERREPARRNDLTDLERGIETTIGDCSNPLPGDQPRYQTCDPPAGATFGVADWTAVINEVLAEIFAAGQVLDHFGTSTACVPRCSWPKTRSCRRSAATSGSRPQLISRRRSTSRASGPRSSRSSAASPGWPAGAGAALSVAGDIIAMVPSATPSATSKFDTTYAGIQGQFADSVDEAVKQSAALSQTVRQDLGLLTLVARLRERGTWQPDLIGVRSAADQAFVAWVYKSLLPAIYDRYEVTDCPAAGDVPCYAPSYSATYPGVVGSANGPNFTTLGPPPQNGVRRRASAPSPATSRPRPRISRTGSSARSPRSATTSRQRRHRVDLRLQPRPERVQDGRPARPGQRLELHDLRRRPHGRPMARHV